jgi:hypothetical protein
MLQLACIVLSEPRRTETVSIDPIANTDVCTVLSQTQPCFTQTAPSYGLLISAPQHRAFSNPHSLLGEYDRDT